MYRTADLRAYPLREYPVIRSRLPYVLALALTLIPLAVDGLAQPSAESVDTKDSEASLDMTMYASEIRPFLQQYCSHCHGNETKSGGLNFDQLDTPAEIASPQLWMKVLSNVRAGLMPPRDEQQLTPEGIAKLENWIKTQVFQLVPHKPMPGRVTLRRLNRTEYRGAVRDLLGFDLEEPMLPPDDVGYGFDNIGDVLSISPIRLEKYIEAAIKVVDRAVPKDTLAIPSRVYYPEDFLDDKGRNGDHLSFYQARTVSKKVELKTAGKYRIHIYCKIDGDAEPRDPQECRVHVTADQTEFFTKQYHWADNDWFEDDCYVDLNAGEHEIAFTTEPVHTDLKPLRTKMEYRIVSVNVDGPLERNKWEHPPGYDRLYPRDKPPTDVDERRVYAREILQRFSSKAFRRPTPEGTLEKLIELAERTYSLPDKSFEEGIAQSIVAILASPKFLYLIEQAEPTTESGSAEKIDEYSLAARLSFMLWRTIPDDELFQLAADQKLRANFQQQVERMIADPKSNGFVQAFSNQWLQTNAILDIPINSESVMAIEKLSENKDESAKGPPDRSNSVPPRFPNGFGGFRRRREYNGTELIPSVREAMKKESESCFAYIMKEDRSVLEFLDCSYTFVNAELAKLYGIDGVEGPELRKVELPENSPRGGVLTQGSVLTVTSNPTRTSPVKRGKWVLENILGAPTAPPPPNVPALEDTITKSGDKKLTQRQALAMHRENPLCASCHARMDPLGLALENFNAFGRFRTVEHGEPVDPAGEMVTGEVFNEVRELKKALVTKHKMEFYRNLTSKLLTYALGRGMEYYDIAAIDEVADRMNRNEGRFSALLLGVLESKPFHQRLTVSAVDQLANATSVHAVTNSSTTSSSTPPGEDNK